MDTAVKPAAIPAGTAKLSVKRFFTTNKVKPYELIQWVRRDAVIKDSKGNIKFQQLAVEVPHFWSERATNIVAEKYFRVVNGVKENSVRQMVERVSHTIAEAGFQQGLFTAKETRVFEDELAYMLLHQMFAFNSPVWFNIGVPGVKQQASACFIQHVSDDMEDIVALQAKEVMLFKGGSGTGVNLSTLRSSYEELSNGGVASGPVSFMEGFDAWAGVTKSGGGTRRAAKMNILNADHPDILVQKNGRPGFIRCKKEAEKMAHALIDAGFCSGEWNVPGNAYERIGFQNANNSVRVTDAFMQAVLNNGTWDTHRVTDAQKPFAPPVHTYKALDLWNEIVDAAHFCGDPGLQFDSTINKWHTCPNSGRINGSNPCSEYMFLDDTACNLASHNLLAYYKEGRFDVGAFRHASEIGITAMEILVGYADYPSVEIAANSALYRPLGLGYANLGALLMYMGLGYDSDQGRAVAAGITALMSGAAYAQSARMAGVVGAFPKFTDNASAMLRVIQMHESEAARLKLGDVDPELGLASQECWHQALELGKQYGYRNSQISVMAPTGTISFLMDCDTTGVEPMLDLIVYKKLVGGGHLKMANAAVGPALKNLGYSDPSIKTILEEMSKGGQLPDSIISNQHRKVFQTAIGKDAVSTDGHLKMMAAIQPFLSGAISKTVNMPKESTQEDVSRVYRQAWELGLKAVAIYRDGCKKSQPANSTHVEEVLKTGKLHCQKCQKEMSEVTCTSCLSQDFKKWGERKRLPDDRQSLTHKFSIGGQEGYVTIGQYPDGAPGEMFIHIAKAGSTLHGFADMWATAVSVGLQYGVPLETYIDKFKGSKFEPSGFTRNEKVRSTSSIGDYLARYLEDRFILNPQPTIDQLIHQVASSGAVQEAVKVAEAKSEEIRQKSMYTGDPCPSCGNITVKTGTCATCQSCGTTTGCG